MSRSSSLAPPPGGSSEPWLRTVSDGFSFLGREEAPRCSVLLLAARTPSAAARRQRTRATGVACSVGIHCRAERRGHVRRHGGNAHQDEHAMVAWRLRVLAGVLGGGNQSCFSCGHLGPGIRAEHLPDCIATCGETMFSTRRRTAPLTIFRGFRAGL